MEATARINGHDCHYRVTGTGPALLYLHGGFGGLGTGDVPPYPPDLDAVAAGFTLVAPDRRSAGRSSSTDAPHTMGLFVDDAVGLLDLLGIDEAVVWGDSAGVAIALQLGLAHPARVRALLLTDGAPWFSRDPDLVERLRRRIDLLVHEGADAAYEARRTEGPVGLQTFAPERPAATETERAERDARAAELREALRRTPRAVRVDRYADELRTYAAYVGVDVTPRLQELPTPLLVVHGTDDTIFPGISWAAAAGLPGVRVVELEGQDHGCARTDEGRAAIGELLATLREG